MNRDKNWVWTKGPYHKKWHWGKVTQISPTGFSRVKISIHCDPYTTGLVYTSSRPIATYPPIANRCKRCQTAYLKWKRTA